MTILDGVLAVVLNLVASIIFTAVIALVAVASLLRRHRRIWKFRGPREASIILVMGTFDQPLPPLGYRHSNTAVSDALALGYLTHSIGLGYRSRYQIQAKCSADFSDSDWNHTIVLIGGRVRNSATSELLSRAESTKVLRLEVIDEVPGEPRRIIDRHSGTVYMSKMSLDRITVDYGIIYRMKSPFRPHDPSPVLLFYGLHAHGTVGTARVLAPSYAKVLRQVRNLRHLNEFQMLVRVDVAKEEVFPHILAVFPIYDRGR